MAGWKERSKERRTRSQKRKQMKERKKGDRKGKSRWTYKEEREKEKGWKIEQAYKKVK